jgi:hypothetical protein
MIGSDTPAPEPAARRWHRWHPVLLLGLVATLIAFAILAVPGLSKPAKTIPVHVPPLLTFTGPSALLPAGTLCELEGLAVYLPELTDHWASAADRATILWAARAVESEPTLLGLSPHLLLVATVPS